MIIYYKNFSFFKHLLNLNKYIFKQNKIKNEAI